MLTSTCDMCMYGLQLPDGPALRKSTRLEGTAEIIARCNKMCNGQREHTPVVGGARIDGVYTAKFAKEMVLGAEQYLSGQRRREVFAEGGEVAEEDLKSSWKNKKWRSKKCKAYKMR